MMPSVPTRWNSTFAMIQRFVELTDDISSILLDSEKVPEMISAEELRLLKELIPILKTFDNITRKVSSETLVTVSEIIPFVNYMNTQINEISPTLPAKLLVIKIKELLKSKLSYLECNYVASIATILDPRCKKIHFQSSLACAKAVTLIKKLLPETDPSNPQSDDASLNLKAENTDIDDFARFNNEITKTKNMQLETSDAENEIENYLKSSIASSTKVDLLKWWKADKTLYPSLCKIAEDFLLAPGSSTPVKRIFSLCGVIAHAK